MEQRYVGGSGLRVSRLGLGTMTWGRDTDEHESRDQLDAFLDAGGTLLDTAAGYGDGVAEELIGALLRDHARREDVVICTKADGPVSTMSPSATFRPSAASMRPVPRYTVASPSRMVMMPRAESAARALHARAKAVARMSP